MRSRFHQFEMRLKNRDFIFYIEVNKTLNFLMRILHFQVSDLKFIPSYLSDRQQKVKINNIQSNFMEIISARFNSWTNPFQPFNYLLLFIEKASILDFADENSLSA